MKVSKIIKQLIFLGYFPAAILSKEKRLEIIPVPRAKIYKRGKWSEINIPPSELEEELDPLGLFKRKIPRVPYAKIAGGVHLTSLYFLQDALLYRALVKQGDLELAYRLGGLDVLRRYTGIDVVPVEHDRRMNRNEKLFISAYRAYRKLFEDVMMEREKLIIDSGLGEELFLITLPSGDKEVISVPRASSQDEAHKAYTEAFFFTRDKNFVEIFSLELYDTLNAATKSKIAIMEESSYGSFLETSEAESAKEDRYKLSDDKSKVEELLYYGFGLFKCLGEGEAFVRIEKEHVFESNGKHVIYLCPHDLHPLKRLSDVELPETAKRILLTKVGALKEDEVLVCERCLSGYRRDYNKLVSLDLEDEHLELLKQGKLCLFNPIIHGSYLKGDLENLHLKKALSYVFGDVKMAAMALGEIPKRLIDIRKGKNRFEVDLIAAIGDRLVLIEIKRKVFQSPYEALAYFVRFHFTIDQFKSYARVYRGVDPNKILLVFFDAYPRLSLSTYSSYHKEAKTVEALADVIAKELGLKNVKHLYLWSGMLLDELLKDGDVFGPEEFPSDLDILAYAAAKAIQEALIERIEGFFRPLLENFVRVSVILATYNEAENVKRLIPALAETLEDYDREIVLVDDSSEDGTAEVARRVSVPWRDRVKIIVRQERGLTSAQLEGIKRSSGEVIVIMDADGQHDPAFVPKLLEKIKEADLVVASRYIKGGRPEGLSGLKRYAYSVVANIIPRVLFYPLARRVHDLMSGFFAVRREAICDKIEPRVPKLLLEIVVMCRPKRIVEVPYRMRRRRYGESKLDAKFVVGYIKQVLSLVRRIFFR